MKNKGYLNKVVGIWTKQLQSYFFVFFWTVRFNFSKTQLECQLIVKDHM